MLTEFRGDGCLYKASVLSQVGRVVKKYAGKESLVVSNYSGSDAYVNIIKTYLSRSNVEMVDVIDGPKPNAPRADFVRMMDEIESEHTDRLINFGEEAILMRPKKQMLCCALGGEIEDYFGTDQVLETHKEYK